MVNATHAACGKSWGGNRREHCPACCETFNSTTAADLHRVGDHQLGRRCLTPTEMSEAGMLLGEDGIWRSKPSATHPHAATTREAHP